MRIIAGTMRGTKLSAPEGLNTRPTLDRVREAIFSMLMPYLVDSDVLDLFAGSGAMGLEALSRGAKLGAVYSNGIFYFNLPWTVLLVSVIIFYLDTKIFKSVSTKIYTTQSLKKKLFISHNNNTAEITALLDTGNSLVDPISLSPVIIVEYRFIKNLFPEEIRYGLERIDSGDIEFAMNEVSAKGFPLRIIPFSSLGKENGILFGFIPDRVEIRDECGLKVLGKCVIGIYYKSLSKDRSYGALLNPYLQ